MQAGVGLVMPNCKVGALTSVPDDSTSAANSLMKLSQIIFTAVAQLIASLTGCNAHFECLAMQLLVWNGACVLGLFWKDRSLHCASKDTVPSEEEGMAKAVSSSTDSRGMPHSRLFWGNLQAPRLQLCMRSYSDIVDLASDAQRQFINIFNTYGVCVIDGLDLETPAHVRVMHALFGETVKHEFADDMGRVTIDPSAEHCSINVRSTIKEHQPHTDEAYSSRPGAIVAMQCVVPAPSGGETVLISAKAMYDAAATALTPEQLNALFSPDCLTVGRALPGTENLVETKFAIFTRLSRSHVGVRWRSRDSYLLSIADAAVPGYLFLEKFVEDLNNRLILKLKPGQLIVIDNKAVLHGRLPFPSQEQRRNVRVNFYNNGALCSKLVQGFPSPCPTSQYAAPTWVP